MVEETFVTPTYDKELVISCTTTELAPTTGQKLNMMILDVTFTTPAIEKFLVWRVLIYNGASSNILYYHSFREMGMGDQFMKPTSMKLEGFTTYKLVTKGIVVLNVTLGTGSVLRMEEQQFYSVDIQSAYNAVLETPTQASFNMMVSVPHQRIKFLTATGIGMMTSSPRSMYDYLTNKRKLTIEHEGTSST